MEIQISACQEKDILFMEVFDNGIGMTAEQITCILRLDSGGKGSYNSIGVKNIHERIRLYFGDTYGISFDSQQGQYTRVIIRVPVITSLREDTIIAPE
jgi:two-component system sensor histidine kinase YesM